MSKQKKNNRKKKPEPTSFISFLIAIVNLITALIILFSKLKE